ERLLRVLDDGPAILHVDLTGVTFLDCAGIGALVAARNAAIRAGCRIRFSHSHPIVRLVLEVTGLIDNAPSRPIGSQRDRKMAGVRAGYRDRVARGRATS